MRDLLDHCERWNLHPIAECFETHSSILQQVRTADGELAFLKISKPGSDEERSGSLLEWFDGRGSVKLLRHEGEALLLEGVDGMPLSTIVDGGNDCEATEILCEVVSQLHEARTAPPPQLVTLERWFRPLLEFDDLDNALGMAAVKLAKHLISTTDVTKPLHGDIHHDNILHHSERGWLAIDPKGLIGDPHYEFANTFLNPMDQSETVRDVTRVNMLADIIAERISLNRDRLLAFAFCHAVLSALWSGGDRDHSWAMAEIIQQALPKQGML